MSSRPSPPIQPDPKKRLYQASAAPRNTTAAAQLPPFGSNILPPPSSILGSGPPFSPPSHLQPVYVPPSPQMRLGYSDFAAHHRSLNNYQYPYSQPPSPQDRVTGQGVAPLARILQPSPYTPSASNSPSSPLYPSQPFESLPYQESPYENIGVHPLQDRSRPVVNQSPYANYQRHQEPIGIYPSSTASSDSFSTAPTHVGRPIEILQKLPEITDRYNLSIRQQPIAARACGFGERDRRVIDPPPIVQLSLRNYDSNLPSDVSELRWPFNVVHCALLSTSTSSQSSTNPSTVDVTSVADPNNANKMSRRLMGTLVASPFVGIDPDTPTTSDPNARLGCFFVFPDLSCRQNGLYRLRFTLMKVNVEMAPIGGRSSIIGAVESEIFEVFSAKDFPGMRASTALTRELKRQGAAVSVKKGNETKAGKKGKKRGSTVSKSDSDASDSGTGAKSSTKKKIKD